MSLLKNTRDKHGWDNLPPRIAQKLDVLLRQEGEEPGVAIEKLKTASWNVCRPLTSSESQESMANMRLNEPIDLAMPDIEVPKGPEYYKVGHARAAQLLIERWFPPAQGAETVTNLRVSLAGAGQRENLRGTFEEQVIRIVAAVASARQIDKREAAPSRAHPFAERAKELRIRETCFSNLVLGLSELMRSLFPDPSKLREKGRDVDRLAPRAIVGRPLLCSAAVAWTAFRTLTATTLWRGRDWEDQAVLILTASLRAVMLDEPLALAGAYDSFTVPGRGDTMEQPLSSQTLKHGGAFLDHLMTYARGEQMASDYKAAYSWCAATCNDQRRDRCLYHNAVKNTKTLFTLASLAMHGSIDSETLSDECTQLKSIAGSGRLLLRPSGNEI